MVAASNATSHMTSDHSKNAYRVYAVLVRYPQHGWTLTTGDTEDRVLVKPVDQRSDGADESCRGDHAPALGALVGRVHDRQTHPRQVEDEVYDHEEIVEI